jgi:hypothetical protein
MSKRVSTSLLVVASVLASLLAVGSVGQQAGAAPAAFVHPGVLVSRAQLDYIRTQVNAGAQPQTAAYQAMMRDGLLSQSRAPHPRSVVECGPYSQPNNGCTDERQDALAAYGNALAWYITQNATYARKAISLMDAWSGVITNHTNSNAPLQTGWAGSAWPRAAEIIRYTYGGGWANMGRFQTMLRTVYLPTLLKGSNSNGNWELTMMEAAVGISVFLDDKVSYDKAMAKYLLRVPAYVYLTTDGALPKTAPGGPSGRDAIIGYWQGQSTFVNGLTQETCRDFVHTGYGIASISDVAETSRIQGNDLYAGDIGTRLRYALGFQAQYELGAAVPSWLCGGHVNKGLGPVTEVGYNAMGNRLGNVMANTKTLVTNNRPAGDNILFVAWETLTHGDQPN